MTHAFGRDPGQRVRPGRDAEILAPEVFEKLAGRSPARDPDPVGRPRRVEQARNPVGLEIKIMKIDRFVYPHPVTDDRRMVAVAHDHLFDVPEDDRLPGGIAHEQPPRDLLQHEQADLVAAVKKCRRLGIVGTADDVAAVLVLEEVGIPPLEPVRGGSADEGKGLVPVEAAELQGLAVDGKHPRGPAEGDGPDPEPLRKRIHGPALLDDFQRRRIEVRVVGGARS